eukprot:8663101-Heterocapsa_arctica.AAC.1
MSSPPYLTSLSLIELCAADRVGHADTSASGGRRTRISSAVGAADADAVAGASSGGRPRLAQSAVSSC